MPRLIFFGMDGILSIAPLQSLIAAGVEIGAVVVPVTWPTSESLPRQAEPAQSNETDLPLLNPYLEHHIVHIAWENHIPVWEVAALSNKRTMSLLSGFQPDLIVVACFPYIFPPQLLQLPAHGCLNLHPSPLPAYRGPNPLFWMARNGEAQAGVTLHFLNESIDCGDIVSQRTFGWPEGISGAELERLCSVEGAKLLVEAIDLLEEKGTLPRQPQSEATVSYYARPAEDDFFIHTDWHVRRAFNFLRAADSWPLIIDLGIERFFVREAVRYKAGDEIEQPFIRYNDEVWIQFSEGVLKIKI